jgi:hypothetical protein
VLWHVGTVLFALIPTNLGEQVWDDVLLCAIFFVWFVGLLRRLSIVCIPLTRTPGFWLVPKMLVFAATHQLIMLSAAAQPFL